jgi:hypothetical protein
MTKNDILNKYIGLKDSEGQILLDSGIVLKLYLANNYNHHRSFFIVSKYSSSNYKSSKAISVVQKKRTDDYYVTIFELLSNDLFQEFVELLWDMYQFIHDITDEQEAINKFMKKFSKWQYLLDVKKLYLSDSEIKGLIGEILFIDELSEIKNINAIINAWTVRQDAEVDFIFDEIWYEVKTLTISKNYINISSIDQLDQKLTGKLYVYEIERTNDIEKGLTLTLLYNKILRKIEDIVYKDMFITKLFSKGFIDSEYYDHLRYIVESRKVYRVDQNFPKIKRIDLDKAIKSVQYEIYFDGIKDWREE